MEGDIKVLQMVQKPEIDEKCCKWFVIQPSQRLQSFITYGKKLGEWSTNVRYGMKPDGWRNNATYGIKL